MSQDGDNKAYTLVREDGEEQPCSRGYNGVGLAKYHNGDTYNGTFVDGVREGKGVYTYAEKVEKYDGEWHENMRHGIGKMTYSEAGEYNGFWENGKRHGEGVFNYTNGDVYSGWWRFGEKEGTGSYTYHNEGMKLYGEFASGQIIKGSWIFPNGQKYSGAFENNKPKGKGKWVMSNGNIVDGEYEQSMKAADEGDEEPPEGGEKKQEFTIDWKPNMGISESATKVNYVPE